MKLKKSSFIVRYMTDYYDGTLPKNLCQFFWHMVWSLVAIPFLPMWFIVKVLNIDLSKFVVTFPFTITFVVSTFMYLIVAEEKNTSYLWLILKTQLICLSVIVIIFLAIIIVKFFKEKFPSKEKSYKPSILAEYIAAKKAKLCPLIEYVEDRTRYYHVKPGKDNEMPNSDFTYKIDPDSLTIIITDLDIGNTLVVNDAIKVLTWIWRENRNLYDFEIHTFTVIDRFGNQTKLIITDSDPFYKKVNNVEYH